MNETKLNILEGYAQIDAVARDLGVCVRTLRRRIHGVDGWPHLRWGGRIWLHTPTVRKIFEAETKSRNPRRGAK
jgi:hypothetical protein